jgi:hypothetical protein
VFGYEFDGVECRIRRVRGRADLAEPREAFWPKDYFDIIQKTTLTAWAGPPLHPTLSPSEGRG